MGFEARKGHQLNNGVEGEHTINSQLHLVRNDGSIDGVAKAYIIRPGADPSRLYSEGAGQESTTLLDSIIASQHDRIGLRVTELGAGRGVHAFTLARRLRGAHVVAVDTNPLYVAHINEQAERLRAQLAHGSGVEGVVANAVTHVESLPTGSQDLVTSNSLDHVIPTHIRVEGGYLANIGRVLRPGGRTGSSYKREGDVQHGRGAILWSDHRGDYVQDPEYDIVRLVVRDPQAIVEDYRREAGMRVVGVYEWEAEAFDGIPGKSKFFGFEAIKE